MTHSRRLFLCRASLVLFGIAPLVTVFGWIGVQLLVGPGLATKSEWERELSGRLGLAVQIGEVRYTGRNVALLTHVALLDPDSGTGVARADSIAVLATKTGQSVEASQLEVDARQLGLLARIWEHRVMRGPITLPASTARIVIQLGPRDITLRRGDHFDVLRKFQGELAISESGIDLNLEFFNPDSLPTDKPVQLHIVRRRGHVPPETNWQFDTGAASLPSGILAEIVPALARLGGASQFSGSGRIVASAATTSGEIQGTLRQVDLDALVSEQFPHQLSGLATVQIERARLANGKLVELRGALQAENGAISTSLIAAAERELGLSGPGQPEELGQRAIPFRKLATGFHLDEKSLRLAGFADATQPGTLVGNAAGPILIAPPGHAVSPLSLLRTLQPENQFQVPATQQTSALVNLLPTPSGNAAAVSTAASHTPTRLSPAASRQPAVRQPALR